MNQIILQITIEIICNAPKQKIYCNKQIESYCRLQYYYFVLLRNKKYIVINKSDHIAENNVEIFDLLYDNNIESYMYHYLIELNKTKKEVLINIYQ